MRSRFEQALDDLNWEGPDEVGPRSSDIRLVDAAIASASFPWITPSLVLDGKLQERISLVDGGYLENSGAETAREIVAELQRPNVDFDGASINGIKGPPSQISDSPISKCGLPSVEYVPVQADGTVVPDYGDAAQIEAAPCRVLIDLNIIAIRSEVPYERSVERQNFFFDPLTALLSARSRRGESARIGLFSQLCGALSCPPQIEGPDAFHFYESVIQPDYLTLPLGWYLPPERIKQLEPFVVPQDADISNGNAAFGMPAILDKQQSFFGTMKDNFSNINLIKQALDPIKAQDPHLAQ